LPSRGSEVSLPPAVLPGNLLTQLRAVMPKVKADLARHPGTPSPASQARNDRVFGWSKLDELDVDLAATSLVLFRSIHAGLEALVKLWVAARGLPFAVEALALGVERGIIVDTDTYPSRLVDGVVPFDASTSDYDREQAVSDSEKAIYMLRTFVAGATAEDYARALETAKRVLAKSSLGAAVALAVVFSEEKDLVEDVTRRAIAADVPPAAELLLASIRDPVLARELVAKHVVYLDEENRPAWTLLARLGADAGKVLVGEDDSFLPFLEAIDSPEALVALLPFASKKALAKRVQKRLLEHPMTFDALAPIVASPKHPHRAVAAVIVAAIAKAHPERATAAAPKAAVTVASAVPAFLDPPPWLAPKKAKASTGAIDLAPIVVPLRKDEREGDLDPLADYARWGGEVVEYQRKNKKRTREDWLSEVADDKKHGRAVDLDLMLDGPEDLALDAWNAATDPQRLYYPNRYYGGAFLVGLARRPVSFVDGLLKLVALRPAGANRMPIEEIEHVLVTIDGTDVAAVLADHFESGKKFRATAERWAKRHPITAAKAAIPRALRGGKSAAPAIAFLQAMVAGGGASAIDEVAKQYEKSSKKPVVETLDAIVGTNPLMFFPAKLPKLPSFFDATILPPIVLRAGGALPAEAVMHVGTMLAISEPDRPYAGIAMLVEACTRESLRDFAWSLFESWLAVGSPPKEMWVLHALGFLGDDETARRLAPMIRAWPGERAAARAVQGLAVLANIGSDLSLMLLDGIADKVRFASIQTAARERIEQIAKARGLTRDELGDRLVPDLGLDERASLTLDFGPRQFIVRLDEHLAPYVMSGDQRLSALPKPSKSDDAAKAKDATNRFKALKKDIAAVARSRIDRLEHGMIARRRWPAPELRAFFIDKPIVRSLAARLVWTAFDGDKRVATFRIAEDGTLANSSDAPFTLNDAMTASVAHPIDLPEKEIAAWSRLFADYVILQPFAQLARDVHPPSELAQHEGRDLTAPALVFGLEKMRWQRGGASDGGSFSEHSRPFPGTPFTAHVTYSGAVGMGYIEEKELLTIESVAFTRGRDQVPVEAVDPIVVSEVLRDLATLPAST
jgi:hypothetical protein